ncbi:MAG TPA: hypothetical protein ENN31_00940 [Candidatus Vogelbacteria bacterium]|nr:hypothetical protein [Candidatus Vogelbacteria bacterium]
MKNFLTTYLLLIISLSGFLIFSNNVLANDEIETIISTTRIAICGNNIKEPGEQCDGPDLSGATCQTLGYYSGTLGCTPACTYDTSLCTSAPPPSSGGGGGSQVSPTLGISFSGLAYPESKVILLKDAQIKTTTIADKDANFSINVSDISRGDYTFSIYAEDNQMIRSVLLTYSRKITDRAIRIDNIFIPPSLAVDKEQVRQGNDIAVFGQSTPNSEITITISGQGKEITKKTNSDKNGNYHLTFNTQELAMGEYLARANSFYKEQTSTFSKSMRFIVGTQDILAELPRGLIGDLNNDGRVNLIDFSIMAFWYRKPNPPAHVDLNNDGRVDLVDFSIMMFHWTG